MDPVSILGAAGSVVGIASFGLQLSGALYQFIDSYRSAQENLQDVADGIQATTFALDKISEYLKLEEQNVQEGRGLQLFSNRALVGLQEVSNKCLLVFWRIEATVTRKDHSGFERELVDRLKQFNENIRNNREACFFEVSDCLARVRLGFRNRIRWSFIGTKLQGHSTQLQQFQLSLTLMCSVISLGTQRSKTEQTPADYRTIANALATIRQIGA
jgi:hypothetical protein